MYDNDTPLSIYVLCCFIYILHDANIGIIIHKVVV